MRSCSPGAFGARGAGRWPVSSCPAGSAPPPGGPTARGPHRRGQPSGGAPSVWEGEQSPRLPANFPPNKSVSCPPQPDVKGRLAFMKTPLADHHGKRPAPSRVRPGNTHSSHHSREPPEPQFPLPWNRDSTFPPQIKKERKLCLWSCPHCRMTRRHWKRLR